MMKMLKITHPVAAAVLLAVLCGCDKAPTLSEVEAKERSSRMYTNAMDDLQAGRMDAAIRGFERVVLDEPKSYSAHFQLATLLQDVRKDYIGAIAHYRAYLSLRPASDKATVAQDRVKLCDTLLSAEYIRKAGGSATDRLATDNEKLTAERDRLTAQVKSLETKLEAAQRDVARLTNEGNMHRRLLAKFSESDDTGAAPGTAKAVSTKEALAELRAIEAEEKRRRINPTDAELLDEDDEPGHLRDKAEIKNQLAEARREEAEDKDNPLAKKPVPSATVAAGSTDKKSGGFDSFLGKVGKKDASDKGHPETYVVQPGDTLYKISTRFYGNSDKWRAIREANMAIIPFDGRVRAGQVLKLP